MSSLGLNEFNMIALDDLDHCIARASAAMVLTVRDQGVLAFHHKGFLLPLPCPCWDIIQYVDFYTTRHEYHCGYNRYLTSKLSFFTCSSRNCKVTWLYCNDIRNRLWHHHQNLNRASEKKRSRCVKVIILSSCMGLWCHVRNRTMYVLPWWNVYVLISLISWWWFPSLLRSLGNKHQNNTLVSAVHHSTTYTILYIFLCILSWIQHEKIVIDQIFCIISSIYKTESIPDKIDPSRTGIYHHSASTLLSTYQN